MGTGTQTAVRLHGKYCGVCGLKLIDVTAESCPRCQAPFGEHDAARPRSRIAAALLAFVFGGAGAHRFYLGQPGLGLLYVLFAWTLIPCLVSFVDFVRLLAMSDERFAAVHRRRIGGGGLVAAGAIAGAMIAYGIVGALLLPGILEAARTARASPP
jgi:TM2 domain-containing membrane protein YozV